MAAVHNDNTVQYGSRDIIINGTTYIARDIEVTRGTKKITRQNELGEPDGAVYVADFVTGTATLQLASGSTVIPVLGNEFTETFVTSIGAEDFVLSNIGQAESSEEQKFVTINFDKEYA